MEAVRADYAAVQRERPEAGRRFMRRTAQGPLRSPRAEEE